MNARTEFVLSGATSYPVQHANYERRLWSKPRLLVTLEEGRQVGPQADHIRPILGRNFVALLTERQNRNSQHQRTKLRMTLGQTSGERALCMIDRVALTVAQPRGLSNAWILRRLGLCRHFA